MRSTVIVVSLALLALAWAGCGKSTPTATTAATPSTGSTGSTGRKYVPLPPPRNASYTVHLESFEGGAPNGSARAEITIEAPTLELCWRFSELKNVDHPTVAKLFRDFNGAAVRFGLPLGSHYTSQGCTKENELAFKEIQIKPERIFINIHTAKYPEGAVLGPLAGTGKPLNPTKP
jgi:hypothetical protein